MKKTNHLLPFAALVGLVLTAATVHAGTLISDDFSGDSATDLVGTTADVGGTWTGASNTDMKADGSLIAGSERTAYQAVTIAAGEVYTLSADVTLDTGSGAFIAIGFANSPGDGAGTIWADANPSAWMYLNAPAWGIRRIAGPDLGGEVQIGSTVFDTPVNLKVVLDTTNAANYEATWFIDGVEGDSLFIGAPSLTHVFINKHSGSTSGTVDNFLLTDNSSSGPDTDGPEINSLSPPDDTANVAANTTFIADFDEAVALVPGGSVHITALSGPGSSSTIAATDASQVWVDTSISANEVRIMPTGGLVPGTTYAITFGQGNTISDLATTANFWSDTSFDTSSWNVTIDSTAPSIASLSPANGQNHVSIGTNLVATFNEDVTEGSGDIRVLEYPAGPTVSTIAVTSANVSISGAVVTVDLPGSLDNETQYYVELDNGAIEDLSGNAFGGISGNSTWSFTTAQEIGDVIKLDLSTAGDGDGGSLADWNQLNNGGSIWAGSAIRHGDGAVVPGATITVSAPASSGFNNDGNSSGWGGLGSDPYYIAAADDLVYTVPGPLTVTFGGLNDSQSYNVRVYALINEALAALDIDVTDGAGTISRTGLSRSGLFGTVPLSSDLIFSGVSTDGSGNIVVSIDSTQGLSAQAVVLETIGGTTPPDTAYDTWAASNGVNGGQGDDDDDGGLNNFGEFGLGGGPLNGNDDGSLLHASSWDVTGGSELEGVLTILVRSGAAATFSEGDPSSSTEVDGVIYTVAADTTPDVDGGGVTVTPFETPAAIAAELGTPPAGYEYASFYISGPEGYFQVTVEASP